MTTSKGEREMSNLWKTALAIWGSTALAIGVAIYFTHDMRCLWFLLIPACVRIKTNEDNTKTEETTYEKD